MTYEEAKEHLKDEIQPNGRLYSLGWYCSWDPQHGRDYVTLDGEFTAKDLEAIAVYIKETP